MKTFVKLEYDNPVSGVPRVYEAGVGVGGGRGERGAYMGRLDVFCTRESTQREKNALGDAVNTRLIPRISGIPCANPS